VFKIFNSSFCFFFSSCAASFSSSFRLAIAPLVFFLCDLSGFKFRLEKRKSWKWTKSSLPHSRRSYFSTIDFSCFALSAPLSFFSIVLNRPNNWDVGKSNSLLSVSMDLHCKPTPSRIACCIALIRTSSSNPYKKKSLKLYWFYKDWTFI